MKQATLGQRIESAITSAGYNPHSYSRAAGCAVTTVYKWVKDQSTPRVDQLVQLCRLTGTAIADLLDEGGASVSPPQYDAWRDFLRERGAELEDWERLTLASFHFHGDHEPTKRMYEALLYALRGSAA